MMEKKVNLVTEDVALIKAAMGSDNGEGSVVLTPQLFAAIGKSLDERNADIAARYPKLVEECPYETRLAVVAWVMQNIVDHAKEGGSYRFLIYERLGFGPDAYVPLYQAGGMTISNEFNLSEPDEQTRPSDNSGDDQSRAG